MKKKIISLLVAVILVGGMVGALAWQRSREPEQVEEPPVTTTAVHLIQRTEDELMNVVFLKDGETHYMMPFESETGQREWRWWTEDDAYVLDTMHTRNKIRGAFSLFANQIVHEDVYEAEINLADFGLDPPLLTVTASYTDMTSTVFHLGSPTIDMNEQFLMIEGSSRLYTMHRANAERLLFTLDDLIDRNVPVWDTESAEYVLIAQRGHEPIEFEMQEHHDFEGLYWQIMVQPFPGREVYPMSFEHHVFEQFANFWLNDLVSLHPEDLAQYGLDDPSLEFIYRAPHGEAHLLFGDIFFREIAGHELAFIYVMFADRPHVFEALYEPASALFDVNVLSFIERFIALVNIQDVQRLEVLTPTTDFDVWVNQVEDSTDIEPTINGTLVDDSEFRLLYRLLIGLAIDFEVAPFTPQDEPLYTVKFIMFEEDDIELRLFHYNDSFLAVSVDGEDVWFVTNRRNFDMFTARLSDMIAD
ncbi:MAG: DUF4340 domain-containing protein [Defluviitaleaceae bacterium]|nr:DUF4340 domain-containing protein [Defluviitaleaceae bacterium]